MTFSKFINHLNSRDTKIFPFFSEKIKNLFLITFLLFVVFLSKNIYAQNLIKEKQDAIMSGNNQESWMNEALSSNIVSLQIMLGGTIPDAILNGETDPQGFPITSYVPGGLLGTTSQLISSAFTPAASGIEYIAQVKNNFLGKPVYAQESGIGSLNAILPLWIIFRNIVYSLFSVFFIITGIMIMLRVKISPQAVVTIQNSIPRIITSLILVTFSYAIAGLCIDLMNFFLAFSLSLLFNGLGKNFSESLLPSTIKNAFTFSALSQGGFLTISHLFTQLYPGIALYVLGAIIGGITGLFAGAGTLLATGAPGAGIILAVHAGGGLLVAFILQLTIAINIIVFLFALIKCYLTILLKIIFSPLEIGLGALPNSKIGFSQWITELIANLAVFPFSLLFLVIVNIVTKNIGPGLWAPVVLSGATPYFLPMMVGIGAIFMLPKIPTLVPEIIFAIKPSPWGRAIGESYSSSVIGRGQAGISKYSQENSAATIVNAFKEQMGLTEKKAETKTADSKLKTIYEKAIGEAKRIKGSQRDETM